MDKGTENKMTTLYLLRHAKSAHDAPGLEDKDRGLNSRGHAAAARLGRYLRDQGIIPELILCSTAVRTRQTLEILSEAAAWVDDGPEIRYENRLYLASPADIRSVVAAANAFSKVMVVGHNPGLQDFALELVKPGNKYIEFLRDKYPTGALAVLDAAGHRWDSLGYRSLALTAFVRPRDLND
jgi:phosphohistidine phosphatase